MRISKVSIINRKLQIEFVGLEFYNLDSIFYLENLRLSFKIQDVYTVGSALKYTLYLYTGKFNEDIRTLENKQLELVTDNEKIKTLKIASQMC